MTEQQRIRPLVVDMGSNRSCGDRRRIHGPLQPMDEAKPSRALRLAIIVGAAAILWLLISSAAALVGGRL